MHIYSFVITYLVVFIIDSDEERCVERNNLAENISFLKKLQIEYHNICNFLLNRLINKSPCTVTACLMSVKTEANGQTTMN